VRRFRVAGWVLLGLAVLAVAVIVLVGALRAHGVEDFNRWVGWATVAAVPVAAVGVVLVLWDKIAKGTVRPDISAADAENELAAVVLAQAQVERSRLIGVDEAGDQAANVRFVKGSGRFREVGGASEGDLASVLEYYLSLSPGRLVVLGDPGAGKTVLALELLIRLLERRQRESGIPVPVLVSAAAYDISLPWGEWLAEHLAERFNMGTHVAASLVRDGRVLPVVDGLDEMDPFGDPKRAGALVMALNSAMQGRDRAAVVVNCRASEYRALGKAIDRATHIEMVPLTGCEAAEYLADQFLGEEEKQRWEPVLAALRANPVGVLASQLATPWRLTLALTVFRDGGDPAELLPGPIIDPYAQRVDALLLGRYVPARVRLHSQQNGYTLQQVEQWLTALADGLFWQARHDRSATDIRLGDWWRPVAQRVIWLAHISLIAVLALPWLVVGVIRHLPFIAGIGGLVLLMAVVASMPISPKRLELRRLATLRGFRTFAGWGALGFAGWLVVGLALWLAGVVGLGRGLAVGLAAGLPAGLGTGFLLGVEDRSPKALGPRDIIRADGRYGLMVVLIVGLALGFGAGFAYGPAVGLAASLTGGLAFGLGYGADTWARYHMGVIVGAISGSGPMSFGTFLDWAQQAGLLRLSGIAYQFRHRQLQDWLASR
jgi:hypothetical protein